MDELVRWLGEQLDEEERIAKGASWHPDAGTWTTQASEYTSKHRSEPRWFILDSMDDGVITDVDPQASEDEGVARHIAAHDPAGALRDIQSDRILLAAYASAQESLDAIAHPDMYDVGRTQGLEEAVRYRALRFSGRPGYLDKWRP